MDNNLGCAHEQEEIRKTIVSQQVHLAKLTVRVDNVGERLERFFDKVDERWSLEDKRHEEMDHRTDKIEKELNTYGMVTKFVKFLGAAVILVLTLKLGDIAGVWHQIFDAD